MNLKKTVSTTLMAFVLVSVGYLIGKEHGRRIGGGSDAGNADKKDATSAVATVGADTTTQGESRVVVYFFHRKERCATCRKIEAYTHEVVEKHFADALRDGRIEWRVFGFEDPANAKFKEKFDLFTSTVVLAEVRGDEVVRFKDLVESVWEKVNGDKGAFDKYIQDEIDAFIVSSAGSEGAQ